jgi:hypothetical protein
MSSAAAAFSSDVAGAIPASLAVIVAGPFDLPPRPVGSLSVGLFFSAPPTSPISTAPVPSSATSVMHASTQLGTRTAMHASTTAIHVSRLANSTYASGTAQVDPISTMASAAAASSVEYQSALVGALPYTAPVMSYTEPVVPHGSALTAAALRPYAAPTPFYGITSHGALELSAASAITAAVLGASMTTDAPHASRPVGNNLDLIVVVLVQLGVF